jgi:hypothetical protein
VSAPALALSFFDPAQEIHGTARSGATILFEGRTPTALAEGPLFEQAGEGWRAELPEQFALELAPVSEAAELGGVSAHVCRVSGEALGRRLDCLGTLSETTVAPRWEELDALRSISALVDEGNALLALARRPRGAVGHGKELVRARLIAEGAMHDVEDARISTVYDGGGRQRSAGLELWLPGEELPRRGSGVVLAGSSLDLEEIRVHAAVFRWRLEGREGIGAYELMVRADPPAAA